jgi:hypothetical protein
MSGITFRAYGDWKRLRYIAGTTADPVWSALALHPNTGVYTVGGVAANGNYTITIDGVAVTFNRAAGETNDQIATGWVAAAQALLQTTLRPYVESVSASGADIRIRYKSLYMQNGERAFWTVSTLAPGGATLGADPETRWPITAGLPSQRDNNERSTHLQLKFIQLDASDVPIADDNDATITFRVVEAHVPSDGYPRVGVSEELATHPVQEIATIPMNGAEDFGVQMSAVANTATGYATMEIWYREAVMA